MSERYSRFHFPSFECGVGLSASFNMYLFLVYGSEGGKEGCVPPLKSETAAVRRKGCSLYQLCAVIFSSHRRSSTGNAPLSARSHDACVSKPRKNRKKNKNRNTDTCHCCGKPGHRKPDRRCKENCGTRAKKGHASQVCRSGEGHQAECPRRGAEEDPIKEIQRATVVASLITENPIVVATRIAAPVQRRVTQVRCADQVRATRPNARAEVRRRIRSRKSNVPLLWQAWSPKTRSSSQRELRHPCKEGSRKSGVQIR